MRNYIKGSQIMKVENHCPKERAFGQWEKQCQCLDAQLDLEHQRKMILWWSVPCFAILHEPVSASDHTPPNYSSLR